MLQEWQVCDEDLPFPADSRTAVLSQYQRSLLSEVETKPVIHTRTDDRLLLHDTAVDSLSRGALGIELLHDA